jgi:anthranilate phosphoribosyltransferase
MDGMDEITLTTATRIAEVTRHGVNVSLIRPEDFDLSVCGMEDLHGGDAGENAAIVRSILDGQCGPKRDIVLLNAAFALVAAGKAGNPAEGIMLAAEAIDAGRAMKQLERLIELTNE